MAFGGAGIFLSRALAETLNTHYEKCTAEMHPAAGGDERVMRCVYNHTDVKLSNLPALHQMDLGGDLSGVYENGHFPLSLHHWKTDNHEYPVDKMSRVSDICAECFLQRWRFDRDSNMVLVNGYSIAEYPGGVVGEVDWDKAEETWESRTVEESVNEGVWHSLGMGRRRFWTSNLPTCVSPYMDPCPPSLPRPTPSFFSFLPSKRTALPPQRTLIVLAFSVTVVFTIPPLQYRRCPGFSGFFPES
ncbi:MAG: hypothetical protein Q9212_001607 [Teloschistes hypoglaucus]